jgi:hypothetical protein
LEKLVQVGHNVNVAPQAGARIGPVIPRRRAFFFREWLEKSLRVEIYRVENNEPRRVPDEAEGRQG